MSFFNRGGSCESKVEVSFGFRVFGLGIVCFCFRRRVAGSVGRRTRECRVSELLLFMQGIPSIVSSSGLCYASEGLYNGHEVGTLKSSCP